MKKYAFREYNKDYISYFKKEELRLKKISPSVKIEHIGSTSVPGLGGKGIVDVLIGANKKDMPKIKDRLQEEGYIFNPKAGDKNRLFFEKDYETLMKKRRVHLQLTSFNSKVWKDTLKVRDILRKNVSLRDKYAKIKKEAVKCAKGEGKKYREYKNNFLINLTKLK